MEITMDIVRHIRLRLLALRIRLLNIRLAIRFALNKREYARTTVLINRSASLSVRYLKLKVKVKVNA